MAYQGPNPANVPLTESQITPAIGSLLGHGQFRFVNISTTVCRLIPYNGNRLVINGMSRVIPFSGVDITNSGLLNNTFYYIYAYWTGTAIALEASTTGHSMHTDGVEIKTGDPTRTLVGALQVSSSQFFNSVTDRRVASWFNRRRLNLRNTNLSGTSSASTVNLSGIFLSFICWNDSLASSQFSISVDVPDNGVGTIHLYLNGSSRCYGSVYAQTAVGNWFDVMSGCDEITGLSEGMVHQWSIAGNTSGTGTLTIINGPIHTASVDI